MHYWYLWKYECQRISVKTSLLFVVTHCGAWSTDIIGSGNDLVFIRWESEPGNTTETPLFVLWSQYDKYIVWHDAYATMISFNHRKVHSNRGHVKFLWSKIRNFPELTFTCDRFTISTTRYMSLRVINHNKLVMNNLLFNKMSANQGPWFQLQNLFVLHSCYFEPLVLS